MNIDAEVKVGLPCIRYPVSRRVMQIDEVDAGGCRERQLAQWVESRRPPGSLRSKGCLKRSDSGFPGLRLELTSSPPLSTTRAALTDTMGGRFSSLPAPEVADLTGSVVVVTGGKYVTVTHPLPQPHTS